MHKEQVESLPLTRKKQLLYIIKEEPSLLFFVNFTAAIFLVPLAFSFTWLLISYSRIATSDNVTSMQCFLSVLYPALCLLPSCMIAGLGLSGVYNVIHKLVTKTIAHYVDFWVGIKINWKQFLITYALIGLFLSAFIINFAAYYYIDISVVTKLVALIIAGLLLVIMFLLKGFILFQAALFNNTYFQILRNSVGFFGKRIGYNFLSALISVSMYVLILFLPGYFRIIPIGIIALYWLVFESLTN